jgi:predicted enzyme related to lactoylglutathione lyase
MTTGFRTIIIPVKDLDAAKALYGGLLGVPPTVDMAYYVGFEAGDQHVGLDPSGHGGAGGPVAYWHTADIEGDVERLSAQGATVESPVGDVGGGRRRAMLRDADGNVFGLVDDSAAGR